MKTLKWIFLLCLPALMAFTLPQSAHAQYQFGYLSYSKALQNMPEYANAQTALQSLKKKYDDEAQYNEEKFKKMFADYLQGQKNFPEQIMLKRQKELQIAMEQGIGFRQDAQRLLTKAENDMLRPIEQKLDSLLALIGKENGLSFIANTDGNTMPFIHSQAGKDILPIVIARINGKIIPVNTAKQEPVEAPVKTENKAATTPEKTAEAPAPVNP